ncbi:spore germination protein GerW family protein [Myceligenerans pegani]|uniref:Sporulation protein n=1 Tax=Myceligenerans pegani TaxID=2776917 RepID=A0ABR9N000_9MICO|nr:spore germination protein GerW family protein [Myceligenerans sp. TRM 65318]MBE1876489.1 sporulation protein [Myceligenerans sp. TRM 65318]MBE3018760.1 sporulation protein [Myceligenerans sp. TRM 65318]
MRYVPDLTRITDAAAEQFGVRQVFGEAYERDGKLVIPVARIWNGAGGGGGGGAEDHEGGPEGGGGGVGFGRRGEPAGVFEIDDDGARWVPAVDVGRIVLAGQIAAVAITVAVCWAVSRRRSEGR